MPVERIERRTFAKRAIALGVGCIGGYLGWNEWSSSRRARGAGDYQPALGELFQADVVGAEILMIGGDFLTQFGGAQANIDELLAQISGMDRAELTDPATKPASRFRNQVAARIRLELEAGELLQLHGYFLAPTFGRFCAAIALIVRRQAASSHR